MRIVCAEPLSVSQDAINQFACRLEEQGHEFAGFSDRPGTAKETAVRIRDADVAIVTDLPIPRSVIEKTKHLKLLIAAAASKEQVDEQACVERGIIVRHTEGYSACAVAELAVAMMVSLMRSMIQANNAMRTGAHHEPYCGRELGGKTVGIIGLGDVGIRVARITSAMGCRILAYDLTPNGEAFQTGVTYVGLEELFQESDILSVHCPLTPQTEGMVNYELLSLMKPSSVLINVGRSPVIDLDGLLKALREQKIAGAGLDTKEKSRMEKDHTLLTFDNVIVTPHIGYRTYESYERRLSAVEEHIYTWMRERGA